jgi:hypothetical protein
MRFATVESSTLATVAYDEGREVLQLRFRNGAVYEYFALPAVAHQDLLDAPSKGRYFNDAIRSRFAYRMVSDSDAVPPHTEARVGCGR